MEFFRPTTKHLFSLFFLANLAFFNGLAFADDELTDSDEETVYWGDKSTYVGIAGYFESPYFFGLDGNVLVLPDVKARYGRFFIEDTHIGMGLFPWGRVTYSIGFNYGTNFVDISDPDSDSETLYEGLEDRDAAVEWFISGIFYSDQGVGRLYYYTDISGQYRGNRARLSWERQIPDTGPLTITPKIFVSYYSAAYNNYYYGIDEDEARVNRPEYGPNNSGEFGVNLRLGYRFASNISTTLDTAYIWNEEEAKDSPLVDKHYRISSKLSIGYHFD